MNSLNLICYRNSKIIFVKLSVLERKKNPLTTSGGKDSGSLAFVSALDYRIGIAHCNFQLHGMEVLNQNFCPNASANDIPVFITQFDTKALQKILKSLLKLPPVSCAITGFMNY
jgi:tRNA(Ile)-lysidine synthase